MVNRHGLQLAWFLEFRQADCESDCLEVIRMTSHVDETFHLCGSILHDIKDPLKRYWTMQINHIFWEIKFCANHLTQKGEASSYSLVIL